MAFGRSDRWTRDDRCAWMRDDGKGRDRRSEIRYQRTEVGGKKGRGLRPEDGRAKPMEEGRSLRSDDGR